MNGAMISTHLPPEPVTTTRYAVAVHAIAAAIAAELEAEGLRGDAAWHHAEAALVHHRNAGPHRWVFDGMGPIVASASVFEALGPNPDGSRDWVQGSVTSAVNAVVKFDVFQRLVELRDMRFA